MEKVGRATLVFGAHNEIVLMSFGQRGGHAARRPSESQRDG